jgi:hypothetical protein
VELYMMDLKVYCTQRRVSLTKYEAAEDFLKSLVKDPNATPSRPLRKFWDKELIAKVRELADEAALDKETGLDRIERELIFYANFYDWFQDEIDAALAYLRGLRVDPRHRYPANKLGPVQASFVKNLSFGYGNVFA